MKNKRQLLITSLALFLSANTYANQNVISQSVEELRLTKLNTVDASLVNHKAMSQFAKQWQAVSNYAEAKQLLLKVGTKLWSEVKAQVQSNQRYDDRPLYWQRLAVKSQLKKNDIRKIEL